MFVRKFKKTGYQNFANGEIPSGALAKVLDAFLINNKLSQ
jgi:hypothetical protein